MSKTASLGNVRTPRTCSTCRHSGPAGDFYASTPECRKCKRDRSRINRAVIADKVALAERLLALIERMTDSGERFCLACAGLAPDQAHHGRTHGEPAN